MIDLHQLPTPKPFNPHFRPGYFQAILEEHSKWCADHPNATQQARKAAYATISEMLKPNYPTIGDLTNVHSNTKK